MELSLLLQRYFFSFRYLSSRALHYFECNICYGFWKALISGSHISLHFSAVSNLKIHIFVSLIIFKDISVSSDHTYYAMSCDCMLINQ